MSNLDEGIDYSRVRKRVLNRGDPAINDLWLIREAQIEALTRTNDAFKEVAARIAVEEVLLMLLMMI